MPKVTLTKEECYCGIAELYDTIAIKLEYNPATVYYDCRKICGFKACDGAGFCLLQS